MQCYTSHICFDKEVVKLQIDVEDWSVLEYVYTYSVEILVVVRSWNLNKHLRGEVVVRVLELVLCFELDVSLKCRGERSRIFKHLGELEVVPVFGVNRYIKLDAM